MNDNSSKKIAFICSKNLDHETLEIPCHHGPKTNLVFQNLQILIDREVLRWVSEFIKAWCQARYILRLPISGFLALILE